jgi:hypothetical protein
MRCIRIASMVAALALLGACAAVPPLPAPAVDHPASPDAEEAPAPQATAPAAPSVPTHEHGAHP